MGRKILTVIIISAVAFGCNKHDTQVPDSHNLTGDWKYIGFGGGFGGLRFTQAPVKGDYLQFDAVRLLFISNSVQTQTGYSFLKNPATGFSGLLEITDTTLNPRLYDVSITNDTLALCPHNIDDALTNYYARSLKKFNW